MPLFAYGELLGQVPDTGIYISIGKLITMLVLFGLWVRFAQWVDKDTLIVNTWRVPWNIGILSAGIVATGLMLFIPVFLVGLGAFVVLAVGAGAAYVVHRNGLVTPETTAFTPTHVRRLMKEGFRGGKQKLKDVKERVKLTDSNKKAVAIPEEPIAREQYRLTQDLLFDALWRRAGIVDVIPAGQGSKIKYLIDGISAEREPLPKPDADSVLGYIKSLAGLNMEEVRKPQTGKISAAIGENKVQVVVRTGGSTAGEKLSLQMIGPEASFKTPDLGFTEQQLEMIKAIRDGEKGLVILSGPRASGLTTSFYAFARSHDAFLNNIQTVEITKDGELENITRNIYKPSDDRTFAAEVQKIIRTDPDMLFLPEVREAEAATLSCQAAIHKQKVYVGSPGEDVFDAIKNWMTMVNDKALLARALTAVVNQRLVRVLCTECKQPYKPDQQTLRKANLPQDKVFYRPPEQQFDKHGNPIVCQNCQGTGYVGRTGVFDVLLVDDGLRDVLRKGGTVTDIRNYVVKKGALGLQQQALTKVLAGTTSIQEVIRVTRKQAGAEPGAAAPPAAGPADPGSAPARPKPKPSTDTGAPAPTAR